MDNGYMFGFFLNAREVNTKHRHRVCLASLNLEADGNNSGPPFISRFTRFHRAYRVNQQSWGCIYNGVFWRFVNY